MTTMVETTSRQSTALPSISHLDGPKSRYEDHYRPRQTFPSPSVFRFEAGSYDKTSPTISKPVSDLGKTSTEEQRSTVAPPVRHSLPSISEALGRDSARSYNDAPPPPSLTAAPVSTSAYFARPAATTSSSSLSRQPSPTTYPPISSTIAHPPPPPPPLRRSSFTSNAAPSHTHKNPSIQPIQTGHSPPYMYARSSGQYTPGAYSPSPHSAPVHATYPYSSQHGQHPAPPPSASIPHSSHGSIMSAPPQHANWSGESDIKSPTRPIRAHDSSVKRGLDAFDLEASFYELNTNGKSICEFGESGAREVRRIKMNGSVPVHVPTPEDMETMSQFMANMQRAFHRIQEISNAHHAEAEEQQKEMRRHYEGMGGEPDDYLPDAHGGGIGMPSDTKKRRGRAAPPGRCHSCNRAETPEWRRGPDGARTLCNACGLHYAKLTRKMGPQQKAGISSSNLRPKGS